MPRSEQRKDKRSDRALLSQETQGPGLPKPQGQVTGLVARTRDSNTCCFGTRSYIFSAQKAWPSVFITQFLVRLTLRIFHCERPVREGVSARRGNSSDLKERD